jgi:DNA-binding beta-propeller fold protein YncE
MLVPPRSGRQRSKAAQLVAAASMVSLVIAGSGAAFAEPAASAGPKLIALGSVPLGIAIDQQTDMIYVELFDGEVAVINGATNQVVTHISLGNLVDAGIAVDPIRNRIYVLTISGDSAVSVINGATNQVIRTIGSSTAQGRGIAVDPVTNRLYVSQQNADRLTVFKAGSGDVVKRIVVGKFPAAVAVDPTTDTVYVGHTTSGVRSRQEVINGKTNKVIQTISTGTNQSLSVDATTRQVYVAEGDGAGPALVYVLRTTPNGETTTITHKVHLGAGADPSSVAVDSSNHLVLVQEGASQNPSPHNKVAVIDGHTNAIVRHVLVRVNGDQLALNPTTHIAYTCDFTDEALALYRDA